MRLNTMEIVNTSIGDSEEDFIPGGDNTMLGNNKMMANMPNNLEDEASRAAATAAAIAAAADSIVCSASPPQDEVVHYRRPRNTRYVLSRVLIWAIWILGLAIVLHVCWLAATSGAMGAAGLWEVLSLLLVVLTQEALQIASRSVARARRRADAAFEQVVDLRKAAEYHKEVLTEHEVGASSSAAGNAYQNDFLGLLVDAVVKSSSTAFDGAMRVSTPGFSPQLISEAAPSSKEPVICKEVKPSAEEPTACTPDHIISASQLTNNEITSEMTISSKTSWGMDVGAFIPSNHLTNKVPVWDLYAPSEACPPPAPLPTADDTDTAADAATPTIVVTPPLNSSLSETKSDGVC